MGQLATAVTYETPAYQEAGVSTGEHRLAVMMLESKLETRVSRIEPLNTSFDTSFDNGSLDFCLTTQLCMSYSAIMF